LVGESHQEVLSVLGKPVDFPIAVVLDDLDHTLVTEFFQVSIDITMREVKTLGEKVAISWLLVEYLQDPHFCLRYKPHHWKR